MNGHHYEGALLKLCERLWFGIRQVNKKYKTRHGFIGLMIRDPSLGNIDIMHNCTNENDIITILEVTIEQLKRENKNGKSSTENIRH